MSTTNLYFISASNLSLSNATRLPSSLTVLKMDPSDIVVKPVGTVVNFTCTFTSPIPLDIEMHVRHSDSAMVYNHTDSQFASKINTAEGAERVLMVRIRNGLSTVVCSLYNKDRFQLAVITAVIISGATDYNIIIGSTKYMGSS